MATDSEVAKFIHDMRSTVTAAILNIDIWWVYKGKETRPKYTDVMNTYVGFFYPSIHAHFVAGMIALYRLYEKRPDTINFHQLIKILPSANRQCLTEDFDTSFRRAKDIWSKVSIIRNNVHAHLNNSRSVESLFEEAAISGDDIAELINITKKNLNAISSHWDGTVHAFNQDGADDVIRLLDDLQKWRNFCRLQDDDHPAST